MGSPPVVIWHRLQNSQTPVFPSALVCTGASVWCAKSSLSAELNGFITRLPGTTFTSGRTVRESCLGKFSVISNLVVVDCIVCG